MGKRILCVVLIAVLVACGLGASSKADLCTFMVVSDLHFTLHSDSIIYPFMTRIQDLTETIADEVIECRPDAFLLCGDNTNSGRAEDVKALSTILHRIHAAGIPVVVIPGNHDFDLGDRESFVLAYGDLCDAESRDEASLSYMLHIGPFRILAMDDSSYSKGARGAFFAETMLWLHTQLQESQEKHEPVLFLSHHNVLPGGQEATGSSYMIQNPELLDLLDNYGVQLCLSGHRHSQDILSHSSLYEIVSAMPAIYPHLVGTITVRDGELFYQAEPISFDKYGRSGFEDILERERDGNFSSVALNLKDWDCLSTEEQAGISRLFRLFMLSYSSGALADVQEEILKDPYYDEFLRVFADTNYGPWMRYLMESALIAGNHLKVDYSEYLH